MRNKKRILKKFSYYNGDAMAEYLTRMSGKGWHFTGWKCGMIFEKGEPREVSYAVEVFPKGSEMDLRPSDEAKEYAEYCREAGWELIDSWKKFCVFKKIKRDAIPIVTPQERFQNVKRAVVREWNSNFFSQLLLAVLFWWQFLTFNFKIWIFSNMLLFILAVYALEMAWYLITGVRLFCWIHKRKKELSEGRIPFYGPKSGRLELTFLEEHLPRTIMLVGFILLGLKEGMYSILLMFGIMVVVIGLGGLLLAILRPGRDENWLIQIGSAFFFPFVLVAVSIAVISSNEGGSRHSAQIAEIPLIQTDYKEVQMPGLKPRTGGEAAESVMGRVETYYADYDVGDTREAELIRYTLYTSRYPWILEKLWKQNQKERELTDVSASWGTDKAMAGGDGLRTYLVLYPDQLLVLQGTQLELDDAQIRIIRDKLGLP